MYVQIKAIVDGKILHPKGFFYKGKGAKTKIVIIGCQIEDHYKKQIFAIADCIIWCETFNSLGDQF
jgi:hypothetical protein